MWFHLAVKSTKQNKGENKQTHKRRGQSGGCQRRVGKMGEGERPFQASSSPPHPTSAPHTHALLTAASLFLLSCPTLIIDFCLQKYLENSAKRKYTPPSSVLLILASVPDRPWPNGFDPSWDRSYWTAFAITPWVSVQAGRKQRSWGRTVVFYWNDVVRCAVYRCLL